MEPRMIYIAVLLIMLVLIIWMQVKFGLLNDKSTAAGKKAFSYSRVQLAWWTFIVLSAIISIICYSGTLPQLMQSTLVLLGIGSLTTASARIIDISDDNTSAQTNAEANQAPANAAPANAAGADANAPTVKQPHRNSIGENFFLDILSDSTGVSIHRFQAVALNFVIGLWFIYKVLVNIKTQTNYNLIIPDIDQNNLILLGLSAGTYVVLKSGENK